LYLAKIPRRIGFRQSKGWFLFHECVDRPAGRHDVERNLSLLERLDGGPADAGAGPRLHVKPESQAAVRSLFAAAGVNTGKLIIGVNPGSVWPTKRWSPEGFAELIRLLKERYDSEVLIFGGPDDAAVAAAIHARSGAAAANFAGKIDLGDLPAALRECRLLITNDSGPMHIAVACDVPTVAIFCATTPALGFYPYSGRSVVVEKELACRPCAAHGGRRCPLGTEDCSRLIPAAQVLRAVEHVLAGSAKPVSQGERPRPEYVIV
jgi:heptosyltransferase-2